MLIFPIYQHPVAIMSDLYGTLHTFLYHNHTWFLIIISPINKAQYESISAVYWIKKLNAGTIPLYQLNMSLPFHNINLLSMQFFAWNESCWISTLLFIYAWKLMIFLKLTLGHKNLVKYSCRILDKLLILIRWIESKR